jgi:2-oxoglutarate-Fe(II)-dependent dioxygenase family protein
MRPIFIKKDLKEASVSLLGQFPDQSHFTTTVSADAKVIAPDGQVIAIFLHQVIPGKLHQRGYELWKSVDGLVSNRATALGTKSLPRSINRDGTPSPRSGVNVRVLGVTQARQGNLGYFGRDLRQTTLSVKRAEMLDGNRQLIELTDELYLKHAPLLYASQLAVVKNASRFRLWNTAFTTIYLAKNFRTAYHLDSGNLRGVMSALLPTGRFTGGELLLPRWRLAFALKPGDVLLFDPQQIHGNLPIKGDRISAAFFCASQALKVRNSI